jgi:hypothetical protein
MITNRDRYLTAIIFKIPTLKMYKGGGSIFCVHNILIPLFLTIEINKGQYLTAIIYSESPPLRCMGEYV